MCPVRPVLVGQGLPLAAALCLLVMAGALLERSREADSGLPGDEPRIETAIQADQVIRTLDDMELLRALSVRSDSGKANSL